MMKYDYKIVEAASPDKLAGKVGQLAGGGWKPEGEIFKRGRGLDLTDDFYRQLEKGNVPNVDDGYMVPEGNKPSAFCRVVLRKES